MFQRNILLPSSGSRSKPNKTPAARKKYNQLECRISTRLHGLTLQKDSSVSTVRSFDSNIRANSQSNTSLYQLSSSAEFNRMYCNQEVITLCNEFQNAWLLFSLLIPTQHLLNVLIQIANKKGIKKNYVTYFCYTFTINFLLWPKQNLPWCRLSRTGTPLNKAAV
jgi:hypothetical protein